jgi:predicted HicB family RNase H-like nuclease
MSESSGNLMVKIDPRTHRALRHLALDEGVTMRELVEGILETTILRKAREAQSMGARR